MTFRPRPPDHTSRADISRIVRAPAKVSGPLRHPAAPTPQLGHADADSMELPDESRVLQSHPEREPVVSGALSNDRMLRVSKRWATAHYDRPEVVEAVLRSMLRDL